MASERAIAGSRRLELLDSVEENTKLVKHLKAEVFKLQSELEQIVSLHKRMEEIYQNMKEVPVVLLVEYREVKKILPINQKNINIRKAALVAHLATIAKAEKLIVSDKAQIQQLEATLRSWGQILPFKRNDKR